MSSPAPANPRKPKAQQAVTRYVRHDSSKRPVKSKQQPQLHDRQSEDAQQTLPHTAKPAKGANTIASAFSRQKHRQVQTSAKGAEDCAVGRPTGEHLLQVASLTFLLANCMSHSQNAGLAHPCLAVCV